MQKPAINTQNTVAREEYNKLLEELAQKDKMIEALKYQIKPLLTVKEVSEITGNNPGYVNSLLKAGVLPYLKLGSRRVRRKDLDDMFLKYVGYDLTNPFDIKPLDDRFCIEN